MVLETRQQLEKIMATRLDEATKLKLCTLLVATRFRAFRGSGFCGVFLQRDFIFLRRVPHSVCGVMGYDQATDKEQVKKLATVCCTKKM